MNIGVPHLFYRVLYSENLTCSRVPWHSEHSFRCRFSLFQIYVEATWDVFKVDLYKFMGQNSGYLTERKRCLKSRWNRVRNEIRGLTVNRTDVLCSI